MTIGATLRRTIMGASLASVLPSSGQDKLPTTGFAQAESVQPEHPLLQGIASHYGTQKDRFGYVDREDPLIKSLLAQNGINPATLPVRFVAANELTATQMKALYKIDSNKYRLLTASGKPYNPNELGVAMNSKYLNKLVKITNLSNNRSVIVPVIDTGEFEEKYGRVADLSTAAAIKLGYTGQGTTNVSIEILE